MESMSPYRMATLQILADIAEELTHRSSKLPRQILGEHAKLAEQFGIDLLIKNMAATPGRPYLMCTGSELKTAYYTALVDFLKDMLNDKGRIETTIAERKIRYLLHFTRQENLPGILRHGLVPAACQAARGIAAKVNDPHRFDGMLDCTSLSIEFPNYKLLYRYSERSPEARWAIIQLDIELILLPAHKAYFCSENAARVMPKKQSGSDDLCTDDAFEDMFTEVFTKKSGYQVNRSDLRLEPRFPTSPQAEVMVEGTIEPSQIRGILFRSQSDFDDYATRFGSKALEPYHPSICPDMFERRHDYMKWLYD